MLSNAAFYLFVPALLFRTMVRQDLASLPWHTLLAYFVPASLFTLALYAWWRHRNSGGLQPAAAPATRTVAAVYGNAVQMGVPMASALFGVNGVRTVFLGADFVAIDEVQLASDPERTSPLPSAAAPLSPDRSCSVKNPLTMPLSFVPSYASLPMPEG